MFGIVIYDAMEAYYFTLVYWCSILSCISEYLSDSYTMRICESQLQLSNCMSEVEHETSAVQWPVAVHRHRHIDDTLQFKTISPTAMYGVYKK